MRRVVMFDVDGVLADFVRGFRTLLRDELGCSVRVYGHAETDTWDIVDVPASVVAEGWTRVKTCDTFWYRLPPLVDSATFRRIDALAREANVYFVTNRPGPAASLQTVAWLEDRGVTSPQVIVTARKGDTAYGLGATHAIDDKAGNAVYISYHTDGATRSYLVDRPYNRFDAQVLGSQVVRVPSVDAFLAAVEDAG